MYRDDLILGGLAGGATSTATLAEYTAMSTASVWRGLSRLIESGHVFSPLRGVYRLSATGEALLGRPDGEPPAAPEQAATGADDQPLVEPGPLVTPGSSGSGPAGRHDAPEHDEAAVAPASATIARWFGRGALAVGGVGIAVGGFALGRHLLAALAARQAAPPPPVAPEEAVQPATSQSVWPGIGLPW
ncbi:MAG TPA: hypothetical protein VNF73_10905 [Candidatus Saccharimonadales bacterium]|nr:hypothetical protein [Candidatus Saccharimonadales bacterium]